MHKNMCISHVGVFPKLPFLLNQSVNWSISIILNLTKFLTSVQKKNLSLENPYIYLNCLFKHTLHAWHSNAMEIGKREHDGRNKQRIVQIDSTGLVWLAASTPWCNCSWLQNRAPLSFVLSMTKNYKKASMKFSAKKVKKRTVRVLLESQLWSFSVKGTSFVF